MTVTFDLPPDIEQTLRRQFDNLDQAAKEAAFVELYRQHQIAHHQLAAALALSRLATDELLKRHNINYEFNVRDIEQESASLRPRSAK